MLINVPNHEAADVPTPKVGSGARRAGTAERRSFEAAKEQEGPASALLEHINKSLRQAKISYSRSNSRMNSPLNSKMHSKEQINNNAPVDPGVIKEKLTLQ